MLNHQIDWFLLDQVREKNPIVLNVANLVTIDKVADAVSAIGASPIMSFESNEAKNMVELADTITINLGTINQEQVNQIESVLQLNNSNKPVVLDPVAINAVPYRLKFVQSLFNDFHFDVIRGNASEIAALVGADNTSHGIDAGLVNHPFQVAKLCAQRSNSIVVLTGETDIITDGQFIYENFLSSTMLKMNIGSGDILSSIIAAFLGITSNTRDACVVATVLVTVAGIIASQKSLGLGSWQVQFFDQLSQLNAEKLLDFLNEREEYFHD